MKKILKRSTGGYVKVIAKILKRLLPLSWYKILANGPLLVPRYYRRMIFEAERYFDWARQDSVEKDLLLMRKYAHIIDKGIQRKDAEPGHSKGCLIELNNILSRLPKIYRNDPTVQWAYSIVERYAELQAGSFKPDFQSIPQPSVTYENLFQLIRQRRSNRCFTGKVIPQDVVEKLIAVTNWAPSSCNKQPVKCFYTLDPKQVKEGLECCKGGTGFSGVIPSFWVFCADCRGYVWPTEAYLPHIDVSLGVQNLLLAAASLGLSGTILSWAQHDSEEDKRLRNLLNIPEYEIIIVCAVLGYAEYQYNPPARKK